MATVDQINVNWAERNAAFDMGGGSVRGERLQEILSAIAAREDAAREQSLNADSPLNPSEEQLRSRLRADSVAEWDNIRDYRGGEVTPINSNPTANHPISIQVFASAGYDLVRIDTGAYYAFNSRSVIKFRLGADNAVREVPPITGDVEQLINRYGSAVPITVRQTIAAASAIVAPPVSEAIIELNFDDMWDEVEAEEDSDDEPTEW